MTHPLIPQILDLAHPLASSLGLEVVSAVFHTNQTPPVLRVDIRNPVQEDTGLDDCERMSHALESALDASELIPDAYVLEVSSPGISSDLITDRDFLVFKGFPICVTLTDLYQGRREWLGQLIRRDEEALYLNQKGRSVKLPRLMIERVHLSDQPDG